MEQAIATVGIWVAVAVVGHKDGVAGVFVVFLAMVATVAVWG